MRLRRIAIAGQNRSGPRCRVFKGHRSHSMPPPRELKTMSSPSTTSGPAAPWQCAAASPVWGAGVAAAARLLLAGTGGPVPSGGAPCGRPPLPARVPPPLRSGGGLR